MEHILSVVWSALPNIAAAAVLGVCGFVFAKVKGFNAEHKGVISAAEDYRNHEKDFEELKAEFEERFGKIESDNEKQNVALKNMLRSELIAEHRRVVKRAEDEGLERPYSTPDEKEDYDSMYKAYHALDGNGTGTTLWKDYMSMPNYPTN